MYNPFSLEGKTIFVTGASSGIGRAIAIECSRMGATLVLNARNEDRLIDTLNQLEGEGHSMIMGDVSDEEQIAEIVNILPDIDGVCLCAGLGMTLPVQFCNREKMDKIFNINFFGTVEVLRLIFKNKKIKKEGSYVIIDSVGGNRYFSPGNAVYGASKAALRAFSKSAAIEFAARRIRVNCILPAMIETQLIHRGAVSDEQLAEDAQRYPLKRYGQPEEVAYAAIYLLSDASKWVTGSDVVIDGGGSI